MSRDGRRVLVAGFGTNEALAIDTATDRVVARVGIAQPHNAAFPPDGWSERRLSIPFFFQANYDTVVECLRQGETPKYPPVTVGAYRAERFAKTAT